MEKKARFDPPATPPHAKQSLRLWLRMLGTTTIIEKRTRALLKAHCDTTLPRFDMLAALDRVENRMTMGELSKRLLVSNGNVTGIVERLVKDKLVQRQADPGDRRTQFIRLTPEGRKTFRAMAKLHESWVDDMFASVSDRDMETLLALLTDLHHAVHAKLEQSQIP